MTEQDISLGRCLSKGWEALSSQFGVAIGSTVLYVAIASAAGQVPGGSILALFPLVGGLYMIYLGIAKGLKPDISTLFAGFSSTQIWARWLGVGWLLALYQLLLFFACILPGGVFAGIGIAMLVTWHLTAAGVILIVFGCLVTLVLYYAIAVRWIFVFVAGAEGATASDAIRMSTELTEGLRPRIFWIMVVLGLINTAGMLLCYVGVFFTLAVTECAVCSLYLDVKQLKAQQALGTETSAG